MSTYVALLRGINVGGHKMVAMSDLRDLCEALGFSEVKSLLQSGNLIFESDRRGGAALERLLEAETAKRLDVSVDYVVRSAAEWQTVLARNPFPDEAEHDPGHLLVMFLKAAPLATQVKALEAAIQGPEIVRSEGKQLYAVYPEGIGRSKLTNALIEKKLDTRGTGRNWNTVLKVANLIGHG
ncbi:MAG: DUF1697 domain-containing protein [Gemmataceae bacterium]|nr:DUF1697 domain-containing protein [Gemmataceae bacterium]MCI0743049.1 DUF1697 domain-containing protein [Gemmataceae bacterium]